MAREHILVVDDEPGVRRAIERILSRRAQITAVETAEEALAVIEREPIDLVLADVRLPGIDGLDLLSRVKERKVDTEVIVMTGSSGERDEWLLHAIEGGAYFFLTKPFERSVLEALVERCLASRQLRRANQEHTQRIEESLEQARRFQANLYPRRPPSVRGARVAAQARPCESLGGDLYDFVTQPGGTLDLFISDVSGHGVGAAMFTGAVKVAFRRHAQREGRPESFIHDLRLAAGLMGAGKFVTAVHALYDPATRLFTYWNAGHPPIVRITASGEVQYGDSTMPILTSALPELPLVRETMHLEPGDRVLLYSDGLVEMRNPLNQVFGLDPVIHALAAMPDASPGEALYRLEELVDAFRAGRPLEDDVTLMLLSVDAAAPVAGSFGDAT